MDWRHKEPRDLRPVDAGQELRASTSSPIRLPAKQADILRLLEDTNVHC